MRDDSILESESGTATSKALARGAAKGVGALLSLAVMGGLVFWSYKLGTRDATDIPVIRAAAEATKMRPEEPGGLEVAHQGRAVYSVVSGVSGPEKEGYAPAEQKLAAEDLAPVARAPAPTPRPTTEVVVARPEPTPAPAAAPEPEEITPAAEAESVPVKQAEPVRVAQASSEGQTFLLPRGVDPMALIAPGRSEKKTATKPAAAAETSPPAKTVATAPAPEPAPEPAAEKPELVAGGPAPVAAPAARPRPGRTVAAAPQEQPEPRAAAAASPVQIQLGAFDSENVAIAQWGEIKSRNGDLLAGRARVITPVNSGGRRLHRLRAGPFASIDEASTLCRGLKARGEACIVARAR